MAGIARQEASWPKEQLTGIFFSLTLQPNGFNPDK